MLSQKPYVVTPHKENLLPPQKTEGLHPLWSKLTLLIGKVSGKYFLSQDFDNDTVDILMTSWRKGTFSSYSLRLSKWFKYASCNKVSPVEPPVQVALAFLTSLVREGKSFNKIVWQEVNCHQWLTNIKMLLLVLSLLSRDIWKEYLKATLYCQISIYMEYFFTFYLFSQYAGHKWILYSKINPKASYVDGTY